ncbi:MAG: neutral/alkaline non-lysosomal ceramidase N-terminal domain-containing protein [Lentisphaeria bacterium]|nr:neutral/alkaline non-lysosomal ceramidase N-terminal domain-containing protein [Lentisphaeria bacterium]
MLKIGYAQEIITPPVGVELAGYFNKRPNMGMYDDLFVKAVIMEKNGKRFGFVTFDLCNVVRPLFNTLEERIVAKYGKEFHDALVISATHSHTASKFAQKLEDLDELHTHAFNLTADAAMRAIDRAVMNLLPGELEVTSVYNNPYGNVRRYWMKSGDIVTNPGWCNPDIDKPECDFDRTIGILAVKQNGRIAALICNIANHGDTVGGSLVSGDWYNHFTREMQHLLKVGLPVLIVDDASGDINHFDFRQKISQTSNKEAMRIGRGYAAIVFDALENLEPVEFDDVVVSNTFVDVPHRKITPEELAAAKHTLATVPDIKKEGDFESQDLANKVPAALRHFAQRVLDCNEKSIPSHSVRLTSIKLGDTLSFATLPGEPFNGIARAIREASKSKYTFVIELAQSVSGYVPMPECFARGGYEVQANVNSAAQNAATVLIEASLKNMQ